MPFRASEIADLFKIPHLTSSHAAGLHDPQYVVAQSLSRQADVVAALASARLLQLYAAVVAGLLLRELRNSRPFLYKCAVQLAHWLCYSVCFDLATLAIVYFRPPGDQAPSLPPEAADYLVRDFWLAFVGHAFVAFAGAYWVLLLDGETMVINAVQAQGAAGAVLVIGPDASIAVLGPGATEFAALGEGDNANNGGNNGGNGNHNGGMHLLTSLASSVAGILGINISSPSATTLIGVAMRNYSSIPILSTGLAWLFLLHHHAAAELLPLVIFPCVETAAAWHGRNVAPWFGSASRLAFVIVLINGWYNGTASWGLTPFLLLCLGKPFLLLLFLTATGPVMMCQLFCKLFLRAWRRVFPPPGVALANEGPRIHYPSGSAAPTPHTSATAVGAPAGAPPGPVNGEGDGGGRNEGEERERERKRRDELLDELDDVINDARKMGVDASYRSPLYPTAASRTQYGAFFTRSRRRLMLASSGRTGSSATSAPSASSPELPQHVAQTAPLPASAAHPSAASAAVSWPASVTAGAAPPPPPSARTGDECVYCWTAARTVLLEPCAHLCLCDGCRELLASKGETRCPVCRRDVKMFRRIFRA